MTALDSYLLTAIFFLALQSYITRAIPFVFSRFLAKNRIFKAMALLLPGPLMLLLVLHGINFTQLSEYPHGIPEIISLMVVTLIHLVKRNIIISIFGGTVFYLIINSYF